MSRVNEIKNKNVYEVYKGKTYMKHTIEMLTPLDSVGLSEIESQILFTGQMIKSEKYKEIVKGINDKILEDLQNTFESDIVRIETIICKNGEK